MGETSIIGQPSPVVRRTNRPYPPSWIDRLNDWVDRLPAPLGILSLPVALLVDHRRKRQQVVGWYTPL